MFLTAWRKIVLTNSLLYAMQKYYWNAFKKQAWWLLRIAFRNLISDKILQARNNLQQEIFDKWNQCKGKRAKWPVSI